MDSLATALIRQYQKSMPREAADALKCVPRIKCWICLDTEHVIYPRYLPTFLGYSEFALKTCYKCQHRDDQIKCLDSNRQTIRDRPIPYYGYSPPYTESDWVRTLAEIYRRDYQSIDAQEEKAFAGMSDDQVLAVSNWQQVQSSMMDMHIREWELEVDVKSVVDHVAVAVQAYSGNLLPLVDLVSSLKVKFGMSSEQSAIEENVTCVDMDNTGQPFLMKVTYRMTDDKDGLDVGILNYLRTSKHLRGELKLMKPSLGDTAANEICRRMISREAKKIVGDF